MKELINAIRVIKLRKKSNSLKHLYIFSPIILIKIFLRKSDWFLYFAIFFAHIIIKALNAIFKNFLCFFERLVFLKIMQKAIKELSIIENNGEKLLCLKAIEIRNQKGTEAVSLRQGNSEKAFIA
jgi:hypothetical protein